MAVDVNSMRKTDLGALIAGALAFVLSLIPLVRSIDFGFDIPGYGDSDSFNAWHGYGSLAILLLMAATALMAVRVFAPAAVSSVPVSLALVAAGIAALGTLLVVLYVLTYDGGAPSGLFDGSGIEFKPGIVGFLLILAALALTALCALSFKESGEPATRSNQGSSTGMGYSGSSAGDGGYQQAPPAGPPYSGGPAAPPPPSGGAPMAPPPPAPGTGAPGSVPPPPPPTSGEEPPRSAY